MSYRLVIRKSAERDLATLDGRTLDRVDRSIKALQSNPFPPGVKELKGHLAGHLRIKAGKEPRADGEGKGDYRVVYRVSGDVVEVTVIKHRRDVYR